MFEHFLDLSLSVLKSYPQITSLNVALSSYLHREHHHVRGVAPLRVRVRPYRRHFLHLSHPDGAADGGADHPDVALAHDRRRAAELGLLRRLACVLAQVHR